MNNHAIKMNASQHPRFAGLMPLNWVGLSFLSEHENELTIPPAGDIKGIPHRYLKFYLQHKRTTLYKE